MKFGVEVTGFGSYADPAVVAEAARCAEAAGWDGLFIWDHLAWVGGIPSGDPWISLAAAVSALDRLSNGRVIFGAGLGGSEAEYTTFGEEPDAKVRASKLDDSLEILDQLWRGQRVEHHGTNYTVAGATLSPLPVQQPRPPIWVGGAALPALRRAGRWDGYAAGAIVDEHGTVIVQPDEIRRRVDVIGRSDDFDVVVVGNSRPGEPDLPRAYQSAGATWWLECIHDLRGPLDDMLDRVRAGP